MQLIAYCKESPGCLPGRFHLHPKIWLIMKLTLFLLLVACFQVQGKVYSQTVTLSEKNAPLEAVLKKIKKQAGFHLVYREEWMSRSRRVNINLKDASVKEALDACFKGQSLTYELINNTVVLKLVEPPVVQAPKANAGTQAIIVTGVVMDENGVVLEDVSIVEKGTGNGASTGADGTFRITVAGERSVLVFSYVGKEQQEVTVGKQESLTIILKDALSDMEDVVVIAYGSQKKVTVTGSVSTVNTAELKQSSATNLSAALAGRLPGLSATQGSGQPGRDDATLFLRGAATTNGRGPLVLIDGVPRDNIREIDPNEVASISVLKDASATAVFGVRGANGVILITTKRGTAGKTQLTASVDQTFTGFAREPERLTSLEYLELRNEAARNDGIALPYTEEYIGKFRDPYQGLDPNAPDYEDRKAFRDYIYPNHDWYRKMITRYAPQTRVNLGATGGTDKVGFFVNGVYLRQGGNLSVEPAPQLGYDASSWMDRFNFRSNLDYKLTSDLKLSLDIGSYIERINMPSAGLYGGSTDWMITDLIYQVQTITPNTPGPLVLPGYDIPEGALVDPGYLDRAAYEIINRMGFRNEMRSQLNSSFAADWDLSNLVTPGLSVRGMISYDQRSTSAMQGYKVEPLYLALVDHEHDTLSYAVRRGNAEPLSITKGVDSRYNINMQATVNYKRRFGRHDVGGMFLAQRDYWETTAGEIPFNVIGVSGRATYSYDDRYLAEVNMGYNGSEQFAPSKRFGFFPAVSAGWVVSNESFMRDLNYYISNLKFRASYGKVGNDRMGSARFLYMDNITMGGGPLGSLGRGQGVNQGLLGNPNITWEQATKQNYAIDLGLFNELDISFDYYIENRTDILISRNTVPELQGVPLGNIPRVNMGEVNNKGFEIELRYNKTLNKDVSFGLYGNFGVNKNKVIFMDEPMSDETYAHQYRITGYPMGQAWGNEIDYSNGNGIFNSQQELDAYLSRTTYGFGVPRVGDFIYKDVNGDGIVDNKDEVPIKYSNIPGRTYGLGFNFRYKGFDLNVFFQGVGKYSTLYANQGVYENIKLGTYYGYHKAAWTPERYAAGEKITYPALSTITTTNHRANDFFIMDRSFVRLKNIELSYSLSPPLLRDIKLQGVRFYISAHNFYTWHNLKMEHMDPEQGSSIGYPVTKSLSFGANINF